MEIVYENNYQEDFCISESNLNQSLINVIVGEDLTCESVSIIWVDDDELRNMHVQFLNDPTFTDIMTFNLGDENILEVELYISVDRAKDHAEKFKVTEENELARLVIHGMLHLSGYDDHSDEEQIEMRAMENKYLSMLF